MGTVRSMTAFARVAHSFEYGTLIFEVQSVNRRFLELNFHLPRTLMSFEPLLRKLFSAQVARGALNIYVKCDLHPTASKRVTADLALAQGLKEAWQELAHRLGLEEKVTLEMLARNKELFSTQSEMQDDTLYNTAFTTITTQVLKELSKAKEAEGAQLAADIFERVKTIEAHCLQIEANSKNCIEGYRLKLEERLEKLFSKSMVEDERLVKEIALLAERVDITEELVRLKSHILHVKELLISSALSPLETKGKRLDFLAQEMLREVNTIGSKALDKNIIYFVIECKAELEKIKEQSQNIE